MVQEAGTHRAAHDLSIVHLTCKAASVEMEADCQLKWRQIVVVQEAGPHRDRGCEVDAEEVEGAHDSHTRPL